MKILILQGGARKKGNTAHVISLIAQQLNEMTHEIETIYLHDKNLNGCMGCGACKKKPKEIGCVQDDDVINILNKIIQSDAIILSSPLYFWGVNAQLKAVIDRMYSLYVDAHTSNHNSLIAGKKLALMMTGAGPWENNAECAFIAFKRMMPYFKTINGGELFIGECSSPDEMNPVIHHKIKEFTKNLTT